MKNLFMIIAMLGVIALLGALVVGAVGSVVWFIVIVIIIASFGAILTEEQPESINGWSIEEEC